MRRKRVKQAGLRNETLCAFDGISARRIGRCKSDHLLLGSQSGCGDNMSYLQTATIAGQNNAVRALPSVQRAKSRLAVWLRGSYDSRYATIHLWLNFKVGPYKG
jgi:hypothetical protein